MFLKIFLEIILIGIIVGGSYYGLSTGFFKLAAKPLKIAASLSFSALLCKVIGKFVIAPIIHSPITNYIKDFMYERCSDLSPDQLVTEIPTLLKMAGAAFNVNVVADPTLTTDQMLEKVINDLTLPAVNLIGIGIAFVLLYFVAKLLISCGIFIVNSYVSTGVVGQINSVMGCVLAFVLAFLAAWLLAGVIDFIFHLGMFDGSELIRGFRGGWIYRLLVSFSPIELLLSF